MSSKKKSEKKNFLKIALIIICVMCPLIVWIGFGDQGLFKLYRTEMERQAYIERIRQLTEENKALLEEITRLRSDMKYVESVARKNFNMLKENEVLYRFNETEQPNDDDSTLPINVQNEDKIRQSERGKLNDKDIK